jgi:hypothetical protein
MAAVMAAASLGGTVSVASDPGTQEIRVLNGDEVAPQRSVEKQSPSRLGERNSIAKAMFGNFGRYKPARFPNGPGWTHAHVQRMARKRRNKARNKCAHRG